jgi:hypothetical protein
MKNDIVKITVTKNNTSRKPVVFFGRRLNGHGYKNPTLASVGRLQTLIRQGVVSFYPIIEYKRIIIVMGRKHF